MKKLLALLMSMVICFVMIPISANTIWSSSDVYVVTQEAFLSFLQNSQSLSNCTTIERAEYDYSFDEDLSEGHSSNASLDLCLVLDNGRLRFAASGTLDPYLLSDRVLWEGLLEGSFAVDGIVYTALFSFVIDDAGHKPQISMTIQTAEGFAPIAPVAIVMGDSILTESVMSELQNGKENWSFKREGADSREDPDYVFLGSVATSFDSSTNISGYSLKCAAYLDQNNRFAVTARSYCSNVEAYYSNFGTAYTSIKKITWQLKRNAPASSYIVGTESFSFPTSNYGNLSANLELLFSYAMEELGINSSIISIVVGSLYGKVTRDLNTDQTTVTATFGLLQTAVFDASAKGVPIVYQLAKNPGYVGPSSYRIKSTISYRTLCVPDGMTTGSYFYTNGRDAAKTISFTLH